MGRKVLVTGADGFIGSHVVESFVRAGFDVRAFVFYNSLGGWGWLDRCASDVAGRFEVVTGDIRDPAAVRDAVKDCSIVAHLAALIAIPFSYRAPDTYIETNVRGTLNILQAARDFGVEQVVHTSTSEVYGTARFVPITEDHPLQAQSPYSASKIAADQLALSFYHSFDLPVAVLRPFNTYGPRQSARAVIPAIATQLLAGSRAIKLGHTTPTRDLTFVEDTAQGFVQCAACPGAVGSVTNIGSGFEISIKDLAGLIGEILNVNFEIVTDPQRLRPKASEVERLLADTSRASDLFKWAPKHGGRDGFREGLTKTLSWLSEPANLAIYKPQIYAV